MGVEDWWLDALALAAAIAVSLLAVSGAGGAATQQTPKRGGTVVVAFAVPEPACLNVVLIATCAPDNAQAGLLAAASQGAHAATPGKRRLHMAASVGDGRLHDEAALHAHLSHPSESALERRRSCHGARLPLHPARAPEVRPRVTEVPPRDPQHSSRRRQDGAGRPAPAGLELARLLREHPAVRMFCRIEDLTKVWSDGIDNPKTGRADRERPLPRRALGARTAARPPAQSALLGAASRLRRPHRSSLRRQRDDPVGVVSSRRGRRGDQLPGGLRGAARASSGCRDRLEARRDLGSLRDQTRAGRPPRPPPEQARSASSRVQHRSRRRWPGKSLATSIRGSRRARVPCTSTAAPSTGRTGPGTRSSPRGLADCSSRPGAWRNERHLLVRRGAAVDSLRRAPRFPAACGRACSTSSSHSFGPVGIELVPEFWPGNVIFGQVLPSREFEVAILAGVTPARPISARRSYGSGGEPNWTGYASGWSRPISTRPSASSMGSNRLASLNRADRQLARDVPVIPLYQWVAWAAHGSDLQGFVVFPSVVDALSNAEDWWLDD